MKECETAFDRNITGEQQKSGRDQEERFSLGGAVFFRAVAFGPAVLSRQNKAAAEITSIELSAPKATKAVLPDRIPAPTATTPSMMFHEIVNHSNRSAQRNKDARRRFCSSDVRSLSLKVPPHKKIPPEDVPLTGSKNAAFILPRVAGVCGRFWLRIGRRTCLSVPDGR